MPQYPYHYHYYSISIRHAVCTRLSLVRCEGKNRSARLHTGRYVLHQSKGRTETMHATRQTNSTEAPHLSFGQTRLGIVLVTVSHRGNTAILLDNDQQKSKQELQRVFTNSQRIEPTARLANTAAKVTKIIDAPHLERDPPLDPHGSEQEFAIWAALHAIPPGETAKALPISATAQDVGAACAANCLSVAIPCHRIVKSDGSISGYRWDAFIASAG